MSAPKHIRRVLPDHPSGEHLRKQAKRLARDESIGLAAAQRRLAKDYGFATWAELVRTVDAAQPLSPLAAAAKAGNVAAVRRLLRQGPIPTARSTIAASRCGKPVRAKRLMRRAWRLPMHC